MHVILILTSDQSIYWLDNERNLFLVQDWFKCVYMFITRFICCFLLNYWLSMEAIAFYITIMIIGCNLVEKLMPQLETIQSNVFHKLCYENPMFKAYCETQIQEISSGMPVANENFKRTW